MNRPRFWSAQHFDGNPRCATRTVPIPNQLAPESRSPRNRPAKTATRTMVSLSICGNPCSIAQLECTEIPVPSPATGLILAGANITELRCDDQTLVRRSSELGTAPRSSGTATISTLVQPAVRLRPGRGSWQSNPARGSASHAWRIDPIIEGDSAAYIVVIPEPEGAEATTHPIASPAIHLTVERFVRINPGGVLPYAIGAPIVLLLGIGLVYRAVPEDMKDGIGETSFTACLHLAGRCQRQPSNLCKSGAYLVLNALDERV